MLQTKHGFSKRKAQKGVQAVFERMTRALGRGEEVELPIGQLTVDSQPKGRKKHVLQKFRDIQTGEPFLRAVSPPEKIIRFRPNPDLIERGPFPESPQPDPAPLSSETIQKGEELQELLEKLGIRNSSLAHVRFLVEAAEGNLDRLLARLRNWPAAAETRQLLHPLRPRPAIDLDPRITHQQ
jgi:nucleoid DNA-binding protein